jgi:exostosin family protein
MIHVPERFSPHIKVDYPPNNTLIFEEWFSQNVETFLESTHREYLPIHWTSYYVNHSYGKDQKALSELQQFIDSLDTDKKYYTVLQYDDGILNDISKLDIKVFGSGGGRIDFPIPLITMPHPYTFDRRRDIFCSFAGGMTHPIRTEIVRRYAGKYVIPKKTIPIEEYCGLMARSTFALCPRGYGKSSFRICEALQFGAIPIYISDDFIIPGNNHFNEYGVTLHSDAVRTLDRILHEIPAEMIESLQEAGKRVYSDLFSYEGCKKLILDNL